MRFWAVTLTAATLLFSAGCARSSSQDQAALDEYASTASAFPLPPGETYAPLPLSDGNDRIVYDDDAAAMTALLAYQCAWERQYLTDLPDGEEALAALRRLPQDALWVRHMDAEGQRVFSDALRRADLGDPSALRSDVEVNC